MWWACLGANHLQTKCKPTARTSAALDGLRRHEARTGRHGTAPDDTGRHRIVGLITQRSLVQIQPAQLAKVQVEGLRAALEPASRLVLCLICV